MQNKKIPTDQQMKEIINAREQDILIRELEAVINQLNFSYQTDIKDAVLARTWFGL